MPLSAALPHVDFIVSRFRPCTGTGSLTILATHVDGGRQLEQVAFLH